MLRNVERRVMTVQIEGCHRPRRVHASLAEYLDVPSRGEILLEMEPYIAEDLMELAEASDRFDADTRNAASAIAERIQLLHEQFDFMWLIY